jgi:hypothetical protein
MKEDEDFLPISNDVLSSILREREKILTKQQTGGVLSEDERKKLAMSEFVLGTEEEKECSTEPQIISFKQAKMLRVVGDFTIGDVERLLIVKGHTEGDAIKFLQQIQTGAMSLEEAHQFLVDCREWETTKSSTNLSCEQFFSAKLAQHEKAERSKLERN